MNKTGWKISFDFDSTISGTEDHIEHICEILRNHIEYGDEVIILTARKPEHDEEEWYLVNCPERVVLMQHLKKLELDHLHVEYTRHEPKGPIALALGIKIHYDNDPKEIKSCREHGVIGIPIGPEHRDKQS